MAYADYTYYTSTYYGTLIPTGDFTRVSARASEWIDRLTFGRAASDIDNTTAIKKAMCAVADDLYSIEQDGGADAIQSESIGSSSITYAENSARRMVKEQRLKNAAKMYLGSTGLMYPGFESGEYGSGVDED